MLGWTCTASFGLDIITVWKVFWVVRTWMIVSMVRRFSSQVRRVVWLLFWVVTTRFQLVTVSIRSTGRRSSRIGEYLGVGSGMVWVVDAIWCIVLMSDIISDLIAYIMAMVVHLLLVISWMPSFALIVLTAHVVTFSGRSTLAASN